jgi:glycosyltransferase involved in cell wall biosynthesis
MDAASGTEAMAGIPSKDEAPRMRVLIAQPSLQPPGGANAVAAWMIQALYPHHDVSTLTVRPVDLAAINRFYGTSIDPGAITTQIVPSRLSALLRRAPLPLNLLKNTLFFRLARRRVGVYDVVISGNNEFDFGRPAIQYIHFPGSLRPRPDCDLRWYHFPPLLRAYYAACDLIAGSDRSFMARNLSLVNSDWTGRLVTRWYGVPTSTLYPPVPGEFPDVPWSKRDDAFVCIGRIAPEKNLERVIDIIGAVRQRAPHVRLHLIGTAGHRGYYHRIISRTRAEAAWISVHENLPRSEFVRLVASQRYGIHGMTEEHFGIAVAEMVRAGCITWVPAGGGQVEIVGADPRFLYSDPRDAVAKIARTLSDPGAQETMRSHLGAQASRFTTEAFTRQVREIVPAFAHHQPPAAG